MPTGHDRRDAPNSIVEFVAEVRRRRRAFTALESAALGLCAGALGAAAAILSFDAHTSIRDRLAGLVACAALSGAAAAATWWVERAKRTDLELAQKIDGRLGRGGALASVYEALCRGEVGALARSLEQRELSALTKVSLARAQPAPGWIWLAPPAVGLSLAALALEAPGRVSSAHLGQESELAAAGGDRRTPPQSSARAALSRAREQRAAAAVDPQARARRLADLDLAGVELGRERERAASRSAAREAIDRLQQEIDRERALPVTELASAEKGASPAPVRASGASPGLGGGPEDSAGMDATKSALANGPPDRTMVGSNRSTVAAPGAPGSPDQPSTGLSAEAGAISGRWWPERYDPVVQGWRRALAARRGEQ